MLISCLLLLILKAIEEMKGAVFPPEAPQFRKGGNSEKNPEILFFQTFKVLCKHIITKSNGKILYNTYLSILCPPLLWRYYGCTMSAIYFSVPPMGILYHFSANHIKKLLFILVPILTCGGRSDVAECIALPICISSSSMGHMMISGCSTC